MESILTPTYEQLIFHVAESSQVAATRRACNDMAATLGFDETQSGKLAIAVTEAATNILKHAGFGDVIIRAVERDHKQGIEVIAIDNGPGMGNVNLSLCDGVSTAGTQGTGLGAMRRLTSEFDIYSAPEKGTAIVFLVWASQQNPPMPAMAIGAICLPLPSEEVCGDAWTCHSSGEKFTVMVADGLGHGPDARKASQPAINVANGNGASSPRAVLDATHQALRATRGAAVAVCIIDTNTNDLVFAGVGNIAAYLYSSEGRKQFMSHNGIVGSNMRAVKEFNFEWNIYSMLIMHSDGLLTNWSLDRYPGLESRSPALIAAVLVRDFSRKRDDITVVVIKQT